LKRRYVHSVQGNNNNGNNSTHTSCVVSQIPKATIQEMIKGTETEARLMSPSPNFAVMKLQTMKSM